MAEKKRAMSVKQIGNLFDRVAAILEEARTNVTYTIRLLHIG